jgi:hypothetical protein
MMAFDAPPSFERGPRRSGERRESISERRPSRVCPEGQLTTDSVEKLENGARPKFRERLVHSEIRARDDRGGHSAVFYVNIAAHE